MKAVLGLALLTACATGAPPGAAPMGGLEARYRMAARGPAAAPAAATRVYRSFLARSLYSRCRMWPSDSRWFDARAQRCGAAGTTFRAAARLYLEAAAGPRFLRPVLHDGRLLWLDPPGACAR
jgi:hypothetical protein